MTLDDLRSYGANVDEGLGRCMGMEAMYLRLVGTIETDASFDKLESALAANDLDAAFDAAHALKGVLANLSITPLYEPVYEITEVLRSRTQMDYAPLLATIKERREQLIALL